MGLWAVEEWGLDMAAHLSFLPRWHWCLWGIVLGQCCSSAMGIQAPAALLCFLTVPVLKTCDAC